MGRYEHYKKPRKEPINKFQLVRKMILVLLILTAIIGFVVQIVINTRN
jgi:hypothetical protein